jgi:hypothetical protein
MNDMFLSPSQQIPVDRVLDADTQRIERAKKAIKARKPASFQQVIAEDGSNLTIPARSDVVEHALSLYDTTGADNPNTAIQLIEQANVVASSGDARDLNITADLMNSIRPQDALEGMLASQMVACHNMAMDFAAKAMAEAQPTASIESNLNRSTKLMRLFGQHLETLHRLRQKGQQTIQVQHIHLGNVNQAIVGNMNT